MVCPETLPELLYVRATSGETTAHLTYLDADGNAQKSLTYADLLHEATHCALRLLAAGLTREDVVLASFPEHERHVLLFWACCLAGIRICPLPPLHPDPSRQVLLFNHLQILFHRPTLIAPATVLENISPLVPELKVLAFEDLPKASDETSRIFPHRRARAEDTACFMLTSGSTGNSKAVQLKHGNLLSSVRGKIEHHGTSAASRFLNWIAFDHVACVSETHIHALQANASQWLVSPSAVISAPRNLLVWLSVFRITYTFSPNFLLARCIHDVSASPFKETLDLSSLRAWISGGEAVPVTTAIALADLISSFGAPRNALRAGFGMSETGAGCIYDRRPIPTLVTPSTPKYLSLGTCCPGVNMRVVDSDTGTILSQGESGQLQINGPTVFSKYYGNERATKESFTEDGWFITGDSAQIDQDGNLFLLGRDKDCININGVKHPTQDVEHYIEDANIDGITRSGAYVCPMRLAEADTETYGVFYQHEIDIESCLDATQVQTLKATNRAIANVCAIFCSQAPHVVLPLPRQCFVKTSLGKISRSQLSKAYLRGDFATLQEKLGAHDSNLDEDNTTNDLLSPVETIVADCIASVFFIESSALRRSVNVFDVGASSMHLLRLKHLIQTRLSLTDIPTIELLKRPEVGHLCDYLTDLIDTKQWVKRNDDDDDDDEYQPLVCFNSSGAKPPLFLVHPGAGEVLVFIGLARLLKDDRPVYALRPKGFDRATATFETFNEMVDNYTAAIEREYPSGPYYIAGYSFGGAVAFEIGKKLEFRGKKVSWVGILNLPPHIQWRMTELTWIEVLLNIGMFLSLFPPSCLDGLRNELKQAFPDVAEMDVKPPRPQAPVKWLFERSDHARLHELDLDSNAFIRWIDVSYGLSTLGRTFEPQGRVQGALTTVFCAIPLPSMGTKEAFKRDRLSVWRQFSGERFEMVDVDGEHYTMLSEDHVGTFAEHLRGALRRADEVGN